MIDNEEFAWSLRGREFQAELLLNGCKDRLRQRFARRHRMISVSAAHEVPRCRLIASKYQIEIKSPRDAALVNDRPI